MSDMLTDDIVHFQIVIGKPGVVKSLAQSHLWQSG